MKLGPETKLTRETKKLKKKLKITSCRKIVTSFPLFQFIDNLEQSRSRIVDAWSAKLTFSLIVTLSLTKNKNRTKISLN